MKSDRPRGGEVIPLRQLSDRDLCEQLLAASTAELKNSRALADRARRFRLEAWITLAFAFVLFVGALIVAAATHTHQ